MRRLWHAWDRAVFEPQTAQALGLFRIAVGLLTLYSFALFAKDAAVFFSDEGVITSDTLREVMHRDYHTIFRWVHSPGGVRLALGVLFAAGVLFTIGWRTRVSAVVLFALVASFHERNNMVLNSGDTVLRTMLFFFMFAPAGAAFSVDSLLRRMRLPEESAYLPSRSPPWAQRMMQVQVAVIYLATAYAKSGFDVWHSGHAMHYIFGLVDFNVRGVEQLLNYPALCAALTHATLAGEVAVPLLLWFRASRPAGMLIGVALHAWIIVAMNIPVFGTLMIATYLPFFAEDQIDGFLARRRARYAERRSKVYFDAACPLCQGARRAVKVMDLFDRAEFIDARQAPQEDRDKVSLDEMRLVTPGGEVFGGFLAFRWLALRMPATAWLAPLMFLPGAEAAGEFVYRRIARNRLALVGAGDCCRVHRP